MRIRSVVFVLLLSARASAGGGAATDAYDGIKTDRAIDLHALADVYVQHGLTIRSPRTLEFRAFDVRSDEPSLNLLRLTVAHGPEGLDGRLGFRVDVGVGDTPNAYLRSDPAATTSPDLARVLSYVEQGFVTVTAPVGRGMAIDVGKFGTPVGIEENESPANWCYSRSLLYTLAEPTFHSGLRVTQSFDETLAFSAFWLNGWNTNVLGGSSLRSFAAAASWSPSKTLQMVVDYAGGLERAPLRLSDPTLTFRSALDAYAIYSPAEPLAFSVTLDDGHDARSGGVSFWGASGSARYQALAWLAGVVRGETFVDPDGFTTGQAQRMVEATVTIEVKRRLGDVTVVGRLEWRRDQSDVRAFDGTHRDTATLGLMAAF